MILMILMILMIPRLIQVYFLILILINSDGSWDATRLA